MITASDRIAAAPAAWGICELPGWGYQLPVERVLGDVRDLGLRATELGPDGFVPGGPEAQRILLGSYGLNALGAFCPVILHERSSPIDDIVGSILDMFEVLGADTMVIAAATGADTYDSRPELSAQEWYTLTSNLQRAADLAGERGVRACFHPHIGTLIQTQDEVERVLDGCEVRMCLDTGHLTVAGADAVALARDVPERIAHVHVKDVDSGLAGRVIGSDLDYSEAVRLGMYTVLGEGDIDLVAIVDSLEKSGYRGWYVPELDQMLPGEPNDEGPVAGVRRSIEFLSRVIGEAGSAPGSGAAR